MITAATAPAEEALLVGARLDSISTYATDLDTLNYTFDGVALVNGAASYEIGGVPESAAGYLFLDGDVVTLRVTADGAPDRVYTIDNEIRYPAATAGAFTAADIVFNSGVTAIDLQAGFSGLTNLGGSFSLQSPVTGATISGTDLNVDSATVVDGAIAQIIFTDKYGRTVGPAAQTVNIDPVVITASTAPAIQAAQDGDTLADTLLPSASDTTNYSSNASGTIASATPSWTINGGAAATNDTTVLSESDVVVATITVTDGNGNADTFAAGSTTVTSAQSFALADDGTLQLINNQGDSFIVDDAANRYDGTYSVPVPVTQPVALKAPVLAGDGTPAVGETLTIIPPLWAYEADDGAVTITYTTNAPSGNDVDTTDPDNPTLLVDALDAGTTIVVTSVATQGANAPTSASNGIDIPPVGGIEYQELAFTAGSGADLGATIDLTGYATGDIVYVIGGTKETLNAVNVGGVGATSIYANFAGSSGQRAFVYEYVLTGAGAAGTAITTTQPADIYNVLYVVGVKSAVRVDISGTGTGVQTRDGLTATTTITPTGPNTETLALLIGYDESFGVGRVYGNVTEQSVQIATIIAAAFATGVGNTTATFTAADATVNGRSGMVLIALDEV